MIFIEIIFIYSQISFLCLRKTTKKLSEHDNNIYAVVVKIYLNH